MLQRAASIQNEKGALDAFLGYIFMVYGSTSLCPSNPDGNASSSRLISAYEHALIRSLRVCIKYLQVILKRHPFLQPFAGKPLFIHIGVVPPFTTRIPIRITPQGHSILVTIRRTHPQATLVYLFVFFSSFVCLKDACHLLRCPRLAAATLFSQKG